MYFTNGDHRAFESLMQTYLGGMESVFGLPKKESSGSNPIRTD